MGEPKWHWVERFPGMDTETDPLELGAKMMDGEGVMWTDDSLNGYGDGTYWQVRPGIRLGTGQGTTSTAIYDLVRLSLADPAYTGASADYLGTSVKDVLVGLSLLSSGDYIRVYSWDVGTLPAIGAGVIVGVGEADANREARLVPAGASMALIRTGGIGTGGQQLALQARVASSGWFAPLPYTGPANPDGSPMAAALAVWHKEQIFLMKNKDPRYASRVLPSDRNKPTTYNVNNAFVVEEDGTFMIQGAYSSKERLYIGRSGSLYMLTGATVDKFRAQGISTKYGVAGARGGDVIGPDTIIAFLTESVKPSGGTREYPVPRNISLIAGGELKVIGDRVLTAIRAGSDASRETQVQAWTALRGALLIPKRVTTAAACDALFYSTASGGFWQWTIGATIGACCLRETGGTMYLGTAGGGSNAGAIQYFDPTYASDNGAAFTARLSSPPYRSSEKKVIEEMIVVASQTSGTAANWTAQRRLPSGSYETAFSIVQTGAPTMNGYPQAFRFKFPTLTSGQAKADYINGWRINPPADGVGCRIHAVGWTDKGAGG